VPADDELDALLSAVQDPGQPTNSFRDVQRFVASLLERPDAEVYVSRVSKPGNLSVRADQSPRSQAAKVFVAVLATDAHVDGAVDALATRIGPSRYEGGIVVAPRRAEPWAVVIVDGPRGELYRHLAAALPRARHVEVEGHYMDAREAPAAPDARPPVPPKVTVPLVLDPRIKRMLRLSIASSKAVMIVGPPGTGKTSLLDEALQEMRSDPESYGLSEAPSGVRQVTPEESWTTRDLLGGETVDDDGRLRFRPGFLLEAIRDNEWLFLDEANRADMDKIFGGMLTWLSDKPVVVGRAGPGLDAPTVRLEWGKEARSYVERYELLEDAEGEGDIRFVAGTDWRLVGTFNALDAQRVFRFGQALGRRFARIPLPPITVDDFGDALQPHLDDLPDQVDRAEVARVLRGLYTAHLDSALSVGPALFLAIPRYIASGLALVDVAQLADAEAEDAAASPDRVSSVRSAVATLITEGYLLGGGTWLAQLEPDELAGFRRRVVEEDELLAESQWTFIEQLLSALA
jgi:hypothetical protein